MEEAVYTLKLLVEQSFVETTEDTSTFFLSSEGFYDRSVEINFKDFAERYKRICIPNKIRVLVQQLLEKYNITCSTEEFLSLLAAVQEAYLTYAEQDLSNTMFKDFENLKKDSNHIFDVLETYLFQNTETSFQEVKFNLLKTVVSQNGKKVPLQQNFRINNWFVVDDILRALCFTWDINRSNFFNRKEAILSEYVSYPVTQGSLNVKNEFIRKIDEKLSPVINGKNEKNRCLGFILNLTQMSYHVKKDDIELDLQMDLEYNLKLISHKAVEHLLARAVGLLP